MTSPISKRVNSLKIEESPENPKNDCICIFSILAQTICKYLRTDFYFIVNFYQHFALRNFREELEKTSIYLDFLFSAALIYIILSVVQSLLFVSFQFIHNKSIATLFYEIFVETLKKRQFI